MYLTSNSLKAIGLFLLALALSHGVLASPLVRREDALAPRWNDTNFRLNINTTSLPPPFTTLPPFTSLPPFPTRSSSNRTTLPPVTAVALFAAPPPATSLSSTTSLSTLTLPPPFTTRPPFTSLPPVTTLPPFTNITITRLAAHTVPYNSTTISF